MKAKRVFFAAVILSLLLSLSGCGKPTTAEEIWDAYQKAAADIQCTQIGTAMDMHFSMEYPALDSVYTVQTEMKANGVTTTTQEPFSSLTDMTMDMSVTTHGGEGEDQRFSTESKVYSLMEDGALVSYTNTNGLWLRTEIGSQPEAMTIQTDAIVNAAGLTFQKDETITQWDGKPAACLTTTVTGDVVQSLVNGMIQTMSDNMPVNFDYSALTCDVCIYISTETYLPLAQEVSISGMDDLMNGALSQQGVKMDMERCTATVQFLSFEDQQPIALPEGAREKALKLERILNGNPDNGDGTYTIRYGMTMADVATPEGLTSGSYNGGQVNFLSQDGGYVVSYTVSVLADEEQTFAEKVDETCQRAVEAGILLRRESEKILVNSLDFDCEVVLIQPEEGSVQGYRGACATLEKEDGITYYVEVRILNGAPGDTQEDNGLTIQEMIPYLEAVSRSDLME